MPKAGHHNVQLLQSVHILHIAGSLVNTKNDFNKLHQDEREVHTKDTLHICIPTSNCTDNAISTSTAQLLQCVHLLHNTQLLQSVNLLHTSHCTVTAICTPT